MPRTQSAKLIALWILHGLACARLLRAHGRIEQAHNFEAALDELKEILAGELGREQLTQAMDWASAELWKESAEGRLSVLRH